MNKPLPFESVARLPTPGDNAAIALVDLAVGTIVTLGGLEINLSHTVLEGHRFAVEPIKSGHDVTSWGIPFGRATRAVNIGDYLINRMMLDALRVRNVPFDLPEDTNFNDFTPTVQRDGTFRECGQVTSSEPAFFEGFRRDNGRGTGTRNFVVVLATNSLANGAVRRLAARFADSPSMPGSIDGVVPVTHTEGGSTSRPNNLGLVLRTLAGFILHPNVGAVLAVDARGGFVDNRLLRGRLGAQGGSTATQHVEFLTAPKTDAEFAEASGKLGNLMRVASETERTTVPVSELRVALQCGGSDAFSGVSGNPLAGELAKSVVARGGFANLAETSELIGAESYILSRVRNRQTAAKFLQTVARFQEWAGWHGHSAEGNPSGGNLYRGLYNIVIKSIGAGMKKHPDVRLDSVIEYAEPMPGPGFHFMDSPGNDLESIAGQVASGCNLILFITGNGSITNFPFVPTIKIVTTTRRNELLSREMDINAGRYLDGVPMTGLAEEGFAQMLRVASGERSAGERAGHSQVQIWRDWHQADGSKLASIVNAPRPSGLPVRINTSHAPARSPAFTRSEPGIGLIAPTSLCSGQVALLIAARLNRRGLHGFSRFVALPHTEGCGVSRGASEDLFVRTLVNHARHPLVRRCLFLEHGCEKTHNDEFRKHLRAEGLDPEQFGWAGIQSAGGIEAVTGNVIRWFARCEIDECGFPQPDFQTIAFVLVGAIPPETAKEIAGFWQTFIAAGGAVIVNANAGILHSARFATALGARLEDLGSPTLDHGRPPGISGLHLMHSPTEAPAEIATGLAATGAVAILDAGSPATRPHPFVPTLRWSPNMIDVLTSAVSNPSPPSEPDVEFQITRGETGVSL